MITVYHVNENLTGDLFETYRDLRCAMHLQLDAKTLFEAGAYTPVAIVNSDKLEDAFRLIQSNDTLWFDTSSDTYETIGNPHNWHTRVGDIMIVRDVAYIVDRIVFQPCQFELKEVTE
jgi:hypothetical protein